MVARNTAFFAVVGMLLLVAGIAIQVYHLPRGAVDGHRLDVGILFIIRILAPDDHCDFCGVFRLPLRREGAVFRGHGSRNFLIPALKVIACLGGGANADARPIPRIDRLDAVASV